MSLDILKRNLKDKNPGNLYLFYGPEEYLKNYYLNEIKGILLDKQFEDMNFIKLENKVNPQDIIKSCESFPVFSDRKIVLVKNSGLFKGAKGEKGKNTESFSDYLNDLPEYVCLIFIEEEVDKRIKLINSVKKNGVICQFEYEKPEKLAKWVQKVFLSYDKEIKPDLSSWLVEICEPGMNELFNEINKISLFLGERRQVTREDIDKICSKTIKARIFDLTDAISRSESITALKILDDMIVMKEPVTKILFMIHKHLVNILSILELKEKGVPRKEIPVRASLHPFVVEKILKQSEKTNKKKIKDQIKLCYEMDLNIKTGKINERIAAELILAACS